MRNGALVMANLHSGAGRWPFPGGTTERIASRTQTTTGTASNDSFVHVIWADDVFADRLPV